MVGEFPFEATNQTPPCHSRSRQSRASSCVSCHGGDLLVSRSVFNVALFCRRGNLTERFKKGFMWFVCSSMYADALGRVGSINLHQGLSLVLTHRVHSLACVETLLITFFRIQFEDTCFSTGGNSSHACIQTRI